MWQALRAELAYSRPYLLGGLGLAAGVAVIVSVVFYAVGEEGPPPHAAAGIRGMFLIMAPMIVGFIMQSFRFEERRARLFLAGPLTPRQLAGAMVLLTVILFAIGILAAGLMIGVDSLVSGGFERESLQIVGYVGGLLFAMMQIGLLVQESIAARIQGRLSTSATGWTVFVLTVLFATVLPMGAAWGYLDWFHLHLANLIAAGAAIVTTIVLYQGRTDFTR